MPGFIEGHGHFMALGRSKRILDLRDAASWDEIVERVGRVAREAPPGVWIFGQGWHQEKWREAPQPSVDGVPLHESLSAVSPENPVSLTHASGHAVFVNAAALESGGIEASTPDPPGGTIVRDAAGQPTGLLRESAEGLVRAAVRHGFQLNTHAIGDRANREILDVYARLFAERPEATDLRWRIEHAQHLDPADAPRFAELGVIASMQGVHASSDGPWLPERLGAERAGRISYVWRGLLDAGAVVTNGTDAPVEDVDPIASFHASVTRQMADGRSFHREQAMTRMEALHAYTLANAYAAFEEHLKGSITPGKLADLVVLSRDILTIPEDEIRSARVDLTVLGGRIVYARDPH